MEFNGCVWVKGGDDFWHPGLILNREENEDIVTVLVKFENGDGTEERQSYELTSAQADDGVGSSDITLRNVKGSGEEGVEEGVDIDDLITLTHLHEPSILYTLQERYSADVIYTYTGHILLAINPFWRVPLYSNDILEQYCKDGLSRVYDPDFQSTLPPHVYATADRAYRLMMNPTSESQKRSQSILVSGESGSGKTETTKIIMKYLAILGGHNAQALLEGDSSIASIEQQVLQSNPILEAFGNARTVRNDNSSRFGKFIQIDFDSEGFLVGAAIRTFLLEKIRLVHQSDQERNFHIFYQMLAGACESDKRRWGLEGGDPRSHIYINQSGCYLRRDGVKDANLWDELLNAMCVMGCSDEEREEIFAAAAGILHCGDVSFDDLDPSGDLSAEEAQAVLAPGCEKALKMAAKLLQVDLDTLLHAVTSRSIKVGTESYNLHLNAQKSAHLRNSLCKAAYKGVFDWLVAKINDTIDRQHNDGCMSSGWQAGSPRSPKSAAFDWTMGSPKGDWRQRKNLEFEDGQDKYCQFIGLLDIFGFECFETNYFEQFLINYANERLQQQFNLFVFEMEQEEYEREGIRWDFIEFPENKASIELIEARPAGILSLLDEQCLVPKGTDIGFAQNMYKKLGEHPRFKAGAELKVDSRFMVNHYAGDITYVTEGFLEKNRDLLHEEGIDLLKSSANSIVRGAAMCTIIEGTPRSTAGQGGTSSSSGGQSTFSPLKPRKGSTFSQNLGMKSQSVGMKFKVQLNLLLDAISDTNPHYIRCLKPNDCNERGFFDVRRITSQLAYGGVLAAVRVSRAGFPVRMHHSEFISRYAILSIRTKEAAERDAKSSISTSSSGPSSKSERMKFICREVIIHIVPLLCGSITEAALTKLIDEGRSKSGSNQPKLTKGESFRYMCQTAGVQMGSTKVFFRQQAFNRAEKARTVKQSRSCIVIQTAFRRHSAIRSFRLAKAGTIRLQAQVRMCQARRRYLEARYLRATLRVQKFVRGVTKRQQFIRIKKSTPLIQATFRCYCAQRNYLKGKKAVITIQCLWRMKEARQCLLLLRKEASDVVHLQAKIKAYEENMKAKEAEMERRIQFKLEERAKEAATLEEREKFLTMGNLEEHEKREVESTAAATEYDEEFIEVDASDAVAPEKPLAATVVNGTGSITSCTSLSLEEGEGGACDAQKIIVSIDKATVTNLSPTTLPVVLYHIRVKLSEKSWTVERCFSDFMWLYESLLEGFDAKDLPRPPQRRMFGGTISREFVEERRRLLQDFLVELLSERGHWLNEYLSNSMEVTVGFSRQAMKQLVSKKCLMTFLDQKQPSLQREDDGIMNVISSSMYGLFGWKRM